MTITAIDAPTGQSMVGGLAADRTAAPRAGQLHLQPESVRHGTALRASAPTDSRGRFPSAGESSLFPTGRREQVFPHRVGRGRSVAYRLR
jgi:hypothetical protein